MVKMDVQCHIASILCPLDCHIEIAEGGSNLEIEQDLYGMGSLIYNTQSLHIHDNSSISIGNLGVKAKISDGVMSQGALRCTRSFSVMMIGGMVTSSRAWRHSGYLTLYKPAAFGAQDYVFGNQ